MLNTSFDVRYPYEGEQDLPRAVAIRRMGYQHRYYGTRPGCAGLYSKERQQQGREKRLGFQATYPGQAPLTQRWQQFTEKNNNFANRRRGWMLEQGFE